MRLWRTGVLLAVLSAAVGAMLIVVNAPPAVTTLSPDDPAGPPYVIKLHARWCPVCMATRGVWSTVQRTYTGRVRFVVFDFTTAATTEASRAEARRLGLNAVFGDYEGQTGTVLVLDGASRRVRRALHGSRDPAEYQVAIDRALAGTPE